MFAQCIAQEKKQKITIMGSPNMGKKFHGIDQELK